MRRLWWLVPTLLAGWAVVGSMAAVGWWRQAERSGRGQRPAGGAAEPLAGGWGRVPDFTLIDATGRTVSRRHLIGKVWLATFFFTHCSGPCPVVSSRLRGLQEAIAPYPDARLVSITVDPQRDSPAVLARYAQRYGARPDRWLFLTGPQQEIIKLATDGFHLPADTDPGNHSVRLVLVDRSGVIRGYYDSTEAAALLKLRRDLKLLLRERRP